MLKQIAPEYFEKSEAFLEAGRGPIMLNSYTVTYLLWGNKQHCHVLVCGFVILRGRGLKF